MAERNSFPWFNMNDEARKQYWASLALRYAKGVGLRTCGRLLHTYGSAYEALQNLPDWKNAGISAEKSASVAGGSWREQARIEWEDAQNLDAHILMWHEDNFPPRLRELSDAPILLYIKGDASLLKSPALAVVGARNCTGESLRIAGRFAREISNCGLTVVSGMAYGIDNVAHTHALQGIGKSIGILGTGIDIIYPEANIKTYANMLESGLLISEFAPHSAPHSMNFPIRNRIISGLSLGVLVIEASLRSGSLITARQALEQNREVYVVPGTMFSAKASGCQELIRQGARAVFCVEDIIRDLEMQLKPYNIYVPTVNTALFQENGKKQINIVSNNNLCPEKITNTVLNEESNVLIGKLSEFKDYKNSQQQDNSSDFVNDANIVNNKGIVPLPKVGIAKDLAVNSEYKHHAGDNERHSNKSTNEHPSNKSMNERHSNKNINKRHSSKDINKRSLPQGAAGLLIEFLSGKKSCHIDELSLGINMPIAELNALLIKLEIENLVQRAPGARYSIVK